MNQPDNNQTDLRFRDYINQSKQLDSPLISLISFPTDQGVVLNNGRPGSALAPELIRAHLNNLTPSPVHFDSHIQLMKQVADLGSIPCDNDLAAEQALLGSKVSACLNNGSLPVIIGGGHETSFGHFLGYKESDKPVIIVNIDAHTDVRPLKNGKPHSGSPFRQAIEDQSGICRGYHVFGLNPSSVAIEHDQFVRKHGSANYIDSFNLNELIGFIKSFESDSHVMVTMDMDGVDQSQAPGVSAPNANGFSADTWLSIALELGKIPGVTSFDLCEVNPVYDRDGQTVRLAAVTLWHFLLGVAMRGN